VRIQRPHQRQTATGLVVNQSVNLPRATRRRIRAMQHRQRLGQLDAATYYGGGGNDRARSVAVDPVGNVWIGGSTDSVNLTTVAPLQAVLKGSMDGFVAKFDAALGSLLAGTYIGGSQGSAGMTRGVILQDQGTQAGNSRRGHRGAAITVIAAGADR
jgi:hypothetical protein